MRISPGFASGIGSSATTVNVAVIYEIWATEVLRYEDVPDLERPDGCVLIDVEAISWR
jgi:hypothetical protein